ncbi:MAG: pilus assembly protein PilM [Patescibacteria group bacterium]|nr:pilus assembly protein PilM [Patescibacteria group bacterium]
MAGNFFSIELNNQRLKVISLNRVDKNYEIDKIGSIKVLPDYFSSNLEKTINDQAKIISEFFANLEIKKKNVVITLADNLVYHQILEMPLLKEKELISALKYQADQFIPMSIEEVNLDLEVIKEDKERKKVLIFVAACPKKTIEKIQNTIELAGYFPIAIETTLSSLARLLDYLSKKIVEKYPGTDSLLLINFENDFSTLTFFDQFPFLIKKNRTILIGYQLLLKELMINFDFSEDKAIDFLTNYRPDQNSSFPVSKVVRPLIRELSEEINRFILSEKPSIIFFVGQIGKCPSLIDFLQQNLPSIKLEILNPCHFLRKNPLAESLLSELPSYFSAIGSELR